MYISATTNNNPAMFDRAIAVLRPALEDPNARAAAALYSAGCYDARGNRAEAIRHYRMAVDKVPNDPASLNNLAYLLSAEPSTVQESVTLAKRAVEIAEKTVQSPNLRTSFLETLGVCHFRAGQFAEAEQAFRRATDVNPTSLEAWLGLAESLVELKRLDEARDILQRIDSAPSRPSTPEFLKRLEALRPRLAP
jgi:Flp pilus assembly protein TadD